VSAFIGRVNRNVASWVTFAVAISHELERLFRDARCGRFHPTNSGLVHEMVGKTALGVGLGEQPRWE
jgi:hypothetical protein